jgi:hypothetical protein
VLQIWVEISHKSKEEWGNLSALNEVRAGHYHPTQAMRLARFRKCHIPEDEIYGLIAASKVARKSNIRHRSRCGLENMVGTSNYGRPYHVGFAADFKCSRKKPVGEGQQLHHAGLWDSASEPFNRSGVFAGVRPYAPVELRDGTVSAVARVVGVCKVDQYLGNFAEGAEPAAMIQDMVSTVCGEC